MLLLMLFLILILPKKSCFLWTSFQKKRIHRSHWGILFPSELIAFHWRRCLSFVEKLISFFFSTTIVLVVMSETLRIRKYQSSEVKAVRASILLMTFFFFLEFFFCFDFFSSFFIHLLQTNKIDSLKSVAATTAGVADQVVSVQKVPCLVERKNPWS